MEKPSGGQGNFKVDFIQLFAYIANGEFVEGVHLSPQIRGRSDGFCPDYPVSFFLKSFLNGYR